MSQMSIRCNYCHRRFENKHEMKAHCWETHWWTGYVEKHLALKFNPSCRYEYWNEDE